MALFVVNALYRIDLPGLQYDEVLFVNAAVPGGDDSFVHFRLFGIPLFVMGYIGALKSWLHAPVFAVFGVTPETIRVPSVLLAAAAIVVYYRVAIRLVPHWLAVAFAGLIAVDPAYLMMARADVGPTVLMMLCKAATLLFALRWLETGARRDAWGLALACSLGLFDKLNYMWFAVALCVALVTCAGPRVLSGLRALRRQRGGLVPVGVLALVGLGAGIQSLRLIGREDLGGSVRTTGWDRVVEIGELWHRTFDGSAYYENIFRGDFAQPVWLGVILGFAVFVVVLGWLARRWPRTAADASPAHDSATAPIRVVPPARFAAVLLVVLFIEMVVTSQARSGHHALMAHPLHFLLLVAAIGVVVELPSGRMRQVLSGVTLLLLGGLMVSQIRASAACNRAVADPAAADILWSSQITRLSATLEERAPTHVFSVDWGLHNQLAALAAPASRARYGDLWYGLAHGAPELPPLAAGDTLVAVSFAGDVEYAAGAGAAWDRLVATEGWSLVDDASLSGPVPDGEAQLYRLRTYRID